MLNIDGYCVTWRDVDLKDFLSRPVSMRTASVDKKKGLAL
jgi:hypothetical protein